MNRYLIPRRITQRFEFAPGWGIQEAATVAAGAAAGGLLLLLASLFGLNPGFRLLPPVLVLGASVFAARPLPDGTTLLDLLGAARAFSRSRKLYLYDFSRDDV
jgi:hypothetical protein